MPTIQNGQVSSGIRLNNVVPTVRVLAGCRRPSSAYTLIEMAIAIFVGTIIILSAVTCFRVITKTIASVNELSTENGLLRTGMQLALQDVDYWHSEADANQPYYKGWTRVPQTPAAPYLRRPFQAIRFCPRTDTAERDPNPGVRAPNNLDYSLYNAAAPVSTVSQDPWDTSKAFWSDPYNYNDIVPNPNAMLASDPRSISRVTQLSLETPEWEANLNWTWFANYPFGYPRAVSGDYTLVGCSNCRQTAGALNPRWPTGTGITLSLDTTYTGASTDTYPDYPVPGGFNLPFDNGASLYQPMLWTNMWQRLGYLGLYEYMTPGTPIVFNDSSGHTPDWFTLPLPPYQNNPAPSGSYPGYTYLWSRDFAVLDNRNLGGNEDMEIRMGDEFEPAAGDIWTGRITAGLPFRSCWPAAVPLYSLDADWNLYSKPYSVFLNAEGGNFNGQNMSPQGMGLWGINQAFSGGDQSRDDISCTATTVWLPYNETDVDRADPDAGTAVAPAADQRTVLGKFDYTTKPSDSPTLSTSIFRYGRVGGLQDLCVARVAIDCPDGHRIELPIIPLGTNYRGARQHWRLYSKGIGGSGPAPIPGARFAVPNINCIGDFYDEANGPYYTGP
jgi:hypothetical protein